jgi:hypothetical protein
MDLLRPSKSDVTQITKLVGLGANSHDVAYVLGTTTAKLDEWKAKNHTIQEALKPKARPEYTMNHPDFAPMVEEAFVCGVKRFYRFKEEFRMSTGRYKYYYAALREMDLRVNLQTLQDFVNTFEAILNGGKNGKEIRLGTFWELIINLKSRLKLAFEPQSVKNLAAVAYFDETEDLTTFDLEYGKQKIKLWEEHNIHDFFLTKPIGELLNLNSLSTTDLVDYLQTADQILADLNSGLQKVSEESSSENGKTT